MKMQGIWTQDYTSSNTTLEDSEKTECKIMYAKDLYVKTDGIKLKVCYTMNNMYAI